MLAGLPDTFHPNQMKSITYLGLTASLLAAGWSAQAADTDWSKLPAASKKANVTFTTDIQPLMQASCVRCHGAEHPKAGLRLDTLEGVLKGTRQGAVVKAGDSAHSLLVKSVSQLDPEIAMPPKAAKAMAAPAMIGFMMPQHTETNRAGFGRVGGWSRFS